MKCVPVVLFGSILQGCRLVVQPIGALECLGPECLGPECLGPECLGNAGVPASFIASVLNYVVVGVIFSHLTFGSGWLARTILVPINNKTKLAGRR